VVETDKFIGYPQGIATEQRQRPGMLRYRGTAKELQLDASVCKAILSICLGAAMMLGIAARSYGQLPPIAHFVSPSYPPLARQAGIAGPVAVNVHVDSKGFVTSISDNSSPYPLLSQWAKECIAQWRFHPRLEGLRLTVVFYYRFSGTTADTNPKTRQNPHLW
jgi:TonB family protein